MSSSTSASPCRRFTLSEIQFASKDFKLRIGEGGFGKVYFGKIISEGKGLYVAIKRLDSMSNQGESEFRTEIEMLSTLRHCHLVSLVGYCEENKEMILYHHLHKAETPLNWLQRMKIAIGAGRGLDYLHTGVGTHHGIIHRDVKTSNILLDENFVALISDFGLSRIGPTNQSISFLDVSVKGTFRYLDPECFYTGILTRKTDVFAFGVVLFELLSGKLPVDIRYGEDECSLVRWAQKCLRERKLDQMVDSNIKGTVFPKCLRGFAQIAGNCLHSIPKERPTMTEVVASLQALLQLQIKSASSSRLTGFTWKIHKYLVSETKQISDQCNTSSPKSLGNNVEMPDHLWEIVAGDLINFTYGEMELATRDFGDHVCLGKDSYGKLYKGWVDKMTYSPCKDDTGLPVVVKKLYRYKHFDLEMLKKHRHPILDKLIGYSLESGKLLLVYKFMHNGNFDDLLRSGQYTSLPKSLENNVEMSDHCWEIVAGNLISFTYGEMKLATRDFGDHTYLGKDSYGKLYKGWVDKMTYSPCKDDTGLPIVVKKLYGYKYFDLEMLKRHHHPNLVKLIGYCLESGNLLLVYEFMHKGNYDDLLQSGAVARLPLATKVKIAIGIARGIVFLNKTEDDASVSELNRHKIMLDEDFTAKLSNYDVTKLVGGHYTCLDENNEVRDPDYYIHGYEMYVIKSPQFGFEGNATERILLRNNFPGFRVVFAEILTGERISVEKDIRNIDNFFMQSGKKTLTDLAILCLKSCNEMDSEAQMLTILQDHDKLIQERLKRWPEMRCFWLRMKED